jgi:hypothetical protein
LAVAGLKLPAPTSAEDISAPTSAEENPAPTSAEETLAPTSAEDVPASTLVEDETSSTPAAESSVSSRESSAEDCTPKLVSLELTDEALLVIGLMYSVHVGR